MNSPLAKRMAKLTSKKKKKSSKQGCYILPGLLTSRQDDLTNITRRSKERRKWKLTLLLAWASKRSSSKVSRSVMTQTKPHCSSESSMKKSSLCLRILISHQIKFNMLRNTFPSWLSKQPKT